MRQLFLVITIVIFLASCRNQNQRFNMDVAVDVSVLNVSPGSIRKMVTVTGNLMSAQSVTLTNEMTGAYQLQNNPRTGMPWKMGDPVKKGTVIIRLEDRAYRNNTDIEGERLNLEISEQEYAKLQALFEKGGATRRELVNAEKNLVTARNNFETAQINLDKMSIKAPFDGVITSLPFYSPNVRVEQGQDMAGIMNYDRLLMDITLPSTVFGEVTPGQKSLITNYTSPEDTVVGSVSQISPALNVDTRAFKGRITVENERTILRPGMFVNASIIVQENDSVLTVPPEVILSQMGGKFVFVADGETARKRIVQTGLESDDKIEITDGLEPDEQVVIKGFETLRDGSKINIK